MRVLKKTFIRLSDGNTGRFSDVVPYTVYGQQAQVVSLGGECSHVATGTCTAETGGVGDGMGQSAFGDDQEFFEVVYACDGVAESDRGGTTRQGEDAVLGDAGGGDGSAQDGANAVLSDTVVGTAHDQDVRGQLTGDGIDADDVLVTGLGVNGSEV